MTSPTPDEVLRTLVSNPTIRATVTAAVGEKIIQAVSAELIAPGLSDNSEAVRHYNDGLLRAKQVIHEVTRGDPS